MLIHIYKMDLFSIIIRLFYQTISSNDTHPQLSNLILISSFILQLIWILDSTLQ